MIEARIAWEFESAPVREQLQRRQRNPVPFEAEILARRPAHDELVDDVMQAISDLGTERSIGMALGPIPITAVWSYWERRGLDAAAVQIMTSATLQGDRAYLATYAKKAATT